MSIKNNVILLLFLFLIPAIVTQNSVSITDLKNSSGIFYRNLGHSSISNFKLTLITYANISYLGEAHSTLKNYFLRSLSLCKMASINAESSHVEFYCEQTLKIISEQLSEIQSKNEILSHVLGRNIHRKRRGIINGISYGLKWLAGTPDSDDANYYAESINDLFNNNRQTQTLLKSQIQIISSTIHNFNNSVFSLKASEEQMNENIKIINKLASEMTTEIDKIKIGTLVTEQILTLSTMTNRIATEFNKYIDAVNLAQKGIISAHVITPRVLHQELTAYRGDHSLPITPDLNNIYLYYKLIDLKVISNKHSIIFALDIPLVDKIEYTLYNLIPLPIQHANGSYFSYINPNQPFMLLSQSKTLFTFLPDLNDCYEYTTQRFLCKNVPINKRSDQPICEVMLLSIHESNIPSDCQTRIVQAQIETWNYISNNQWLFVLTKPTTLTVMCNHSRQSPQDFELQKTGILKLSQHCSGYTDYNVLHATDSERRNMTHVIPSISIINDACCILDETFHKRPAKLLQPIRLTNIDLSDLKYADKKLRDLDESLTNQMKHPFQFSHASWYSVLFSTMGGISSLVILLCCCRYCNCWQLLRRVFCFSINPRNGEVIPPVIKNFVCCTFDNDRNDPYHARDVVSYDRRREVARMRTIQPITTQPRSHRNYQDDESDDDDDTYDRPNNTRATQVRTSITRKSNVPI